MTVPEWREFLQRWSDQWLLRDSTLPSRVRESRWLGTKPATQVQITKLEKRLGFELPSSYRNFLLTSNGWSRTSEFIERIRPASKVEWLETDDPQLIESFSGEDLAGSMAGLSSEEYFSYDLRPIFDPAHLRASLVIADPVAGDSMTYLLNPLVVAEDGEWEAWRFAHWIPGAERFPSFELLMRAEYASFQSTVGQLDEPIVGPFEGAYAADRPRRIAKATGRGKTKPPRLTIPQLIAQLESPEKKTRLAAAKQLFREFCPHDPQNEHPELIEPLGRILSSSLETDVRAAAAAMLGSYGDRQAIALLISALDDPRLAWTAMDALFYLSIAMPDPRIGDAMVRLMKSPTEYHIIDKAVTILEELKDVRVAEIGLKLLDHAEQIPFNIPSSADFAQASMYQRSTLRMKGAFAYARFASSATKDLVARLVHTNPEVRVAATAALREDPNRGPHLHSALKPLLDDPDAAVRQQAGYTARSLEPTPAVEISPERSAEIDAQVETMIRSANSRKENRF